MVGIDVSKNTLDATLVDPISREREWYLRVDRDRKGIDQLLAKAGPGVALVMEPTGRYSLEVAKIAVQQGRTVLLAPTRQSKAFRASVQTRCKTDKGDSYGLGLFGLSRPLAPYPIKADNVETVDQLLSARKTLVEARAKFKMQADQLEHSKELLEPAIAALDQQIKAADQTLWERAKSDPSLAMAKELEKVPGIGKLTAVAVTNCLASREFIYPDQFVAYLGLDIAVVQSGTKKGELGLTKQGHADLRRLLYLAAQSNLRCTSSPFKDQYARERAKGLTHTGACCAVARKLAKLCWSLHKHKSSYDPDRVGRPPVRPASEPAAAAGV